MRVDELRSMVSDYRMYDSRIRLSDAIKDMSNCSDPFEWDYMPVITRDGVKELYKGSLVRMDGSTEHQYDYSVNFIIF